ncbi:PTS sugar transporter [Cohnella sp. CIP 111063]|uniref:PTS transporter subunit EIIC n=1 Tax=unclassified Cohnella TaxID=2636738 RepID=UPI000B8C696F|nr:MULTISPECIES: PTS transporter subunit EIIC [unclassified Cohnella]OXS52917.1 PTS sugar transporter [Cohnella sp. CIP 111063]PRX60169.1 PTS system N-acetylglucosamine-specific IIB component (Glc family) /PTS system N-acetylglucosamine-specific IIC component (Glc family) [Cohnella sp. SGD-V74]
MLAFLQKIGKSLMLPVAALPAAALLLRFGNIDYVKDFGWGSFGEWLNHYIAPFLAAGGSAIFDNLPLIFAIGIAIGMVGDAVATLAAVIAHLVLLNVLEKVPVAFTGIVGKDMKLDMGVLGGILAGLVASFMYNRFHQIKLPDWLGFFAGKRFVPIVTSFAMVIIGLLFGLIWGPVQNALDEFGNWVVGLGGIGAFIYMTANRLLIPFGLHHVINSIAWFQIGSFTDEAGKVVYGDLHRFFAGDKSAGLFMTGFFPMMMFALPAAAFAIIHSAKPEKRKLVSSIFVGAAFASFLTGITEPLEFAFMFVAPALYVVHAILAGVSGWLMATLEIKHGFGFSAGFLDYAINYPLATKPLLILPIGAGFALVYYVLFRVIISAFNLKTPGREDGELVIDGQASEGKKGLLTNDDKPGQVLAALGGPGNIETIDACITRLRLVVKDDAAVDDAELKRLGASGVIRLGKGAVQAIFGTQSERLKDQIKDRI